MRVLREPSLKDADLSGADVGRSDLSDADLQGATLIETGFRHVIFDNADVSGATFGNTDITGADLMNVVGLEQRQLDKACRGERGLDPIVPQGCSWTPRVCPWLSGEHRVRWERCLRGPPRLGSRAGRRKIVDEVDVEWDCKLTYGWIMQFLHASDPRPMRRVPAVHL